MRAASALHRGRVIPTNMTDKPEPESSAAWFCLRAQPKHEHIAAGHLRELPGIEVFLPRIRFRRQTRRGRLS